jgi:hypothetical protein
MKMLNAMTKTILAGLTVLTMGAVSAPSAFASTKIQQTVIHTDAFGDKSVAQRFVKTDGRGDRVSPTSRIREWITRFCGFSCAVSY